MKALLSTAAILLALCTVLTGVAYPLVVTGAAQALFPHQANGNLVYRDGRPVASQFIGQAFTSPAYLWGRPSATSPVPYNAAASSGSNLGPSNPALQEAVRTRVAALRAHDLAPTPAPVPVDLVTASGSGLDPEISVAAALYQAPRIARARGVSLAHIEALIAQLRQGRTLGIWGEPRVNVVWFNLALDRQFPVTTLH